MRGKLVYGILKHIKLDLLISKSKKEYINIAIKLAKDFNFRKKIINQIIKNKKRIYNEKKYIHDLEFFFESIF